MQLLATWIARLRRRAVPKARHSVLTFDRYELMTATQALRFEELQSTSAGEMPGQAPSLPDQPWYSLHDACDLLAIDETAVLRAAANGRIRCFVYSRAGAANHRQPTVVHGDSPEFLALPEANCRELQLHGTSDVQELRYSDATHHDVRVPLKQPQRVNLQTVYLQHPLPEPDELLSN